ncbi:uncharacterized protein LOC120257655 isoform X2 [Dioscorea cayenensis subsp. rotundata]|uniref:Uncharacterized protein LOC120257655 isoform X2 n=1 Tax=Dioscorea cayennensis subsp. rotundata TaxID=55577 RepID=A0AB40B2U7_DIOCR|nr:uncharacterized protein LOC120257655 isoform X2 [Dioscorea cayenensis subsp. rotundata]
MGESWICLSVVQQCNLDFILLSEEGEEEGEFDTQEHILESCFDAKDLVVGYMGVPKYAGLSMTQQPQYITIRNERGREMFSLVDNLLEITPTTSSGNRQPFVMETVKAENIAKAGTERKIWELSRSSEFRGQRNLLTRLKTLHIIIFLLRSSSSIQKERGDDVLCGI